MCLDAAESTRAHSKQTLSCNAVVVISHQDQQEVARREEAKTPDDSMINQLKPSIAFNRVALNQDTVSKKNPTQYVHSFRAFFGNLLVFVHINIYISNTTTAALTAAI